MSRHLRDTYRLMDGRTDGQTARIDYLHVPLSLKHLRRNSTFSETKNNSIIFLLLISVLR